MENSRHGGGPGHGHYRMRSDFSSKSQRSFSSATTESSTMNGHIQGEAQNSGRGSVDGRIAAIPGTEKRSSYVKGYTFVSPWQGRCEFSTGLAGSSLKV